MSSQKKDKVNIAKYKMVESFMNSVAEDEYGTYKIPTSLKSVFDKIILQAVETLSSEQIALFEVGCGNGRWMKYLLENSSKDIVQIFGCDLSQKMVDLGRNLLREYILSNTAEIFKGNFVDFDKQSRKAKYHLIYFIDVFQHLTPNDYLITLEKANRLLMSNGLCVIADKERYSYYGVKMVLKRALHLVPPHWSTANYPSFRKLCSLAKKAGFVPENFIKVKNFRGLWLRKSD